MYSAELVRHAMRYLYRGAVHENGYDRAAVERLLKRLDFTALASVFSQQARRVYAYQTWDRDASPLEFRGQDLFGKTAVLVYEDLFFYTMRWTSLWLRTAERAYEIWLKEDGNLVTVSRVGVNHNRGEFKTEFREIRGFPYVCGMELNLERLTEELLALCGDKP